MKEMYFEKESMITYQLAKRGITDSRVLEAMRAVDREKFIPIQYRKQAYFDSPLPIGEGQTISQPYMVALMAQALQIEPSDSLLDVGTGLGYAAAVLSHLANRVYSIERQSALALKARHIMSELGYSNIQIKVGDGLLGWPEYAPYQAISVAAASEEVPTSLLEQLDIGGRLVIPIGLQGECQRLLRYCRIDEKNYKKEDLGGVVFVPLLAGVN